jgi:hypothetical protein
MEPRHGQCRKRVRDYDRSSGARFYDIARQNELYPPDSYVLKNAQEFFAVTGSLYLWGNVDRPPNNRTTLHDKQPVYYQWLGDLFGVQKKL